MVIRSVTIIVLVTSLLLTASGCTSIDANSLPLEPVSWQNDDAGEYYRAHMVSQRAGGYANEDYRLKVLSLALEKRGHTEYNIVEYKQEEQDVSTGIADGVIYHHWYTVKVPGGSD